MMDWAPEHISQDDLVDYRKAAEQAWSDETRHPSYAGHPQSSAGQCYVTSRWLTTKLGGNVGTKDGHYFWVSPDRSHVIDLTGDQFAYEPAHPMYEGVLQDEEDEPWTYDEHHNRHRPGPAMFKRADHPVYRGFRIRESKTEDPRVGLFRERADAALEGKLAKTADFGWGGDSHPGQEPEVVERYEHDAPEPFSEGQEYKWFYGNGRLELSPYEDYDGLRELAGVAGDDSGPMALGDLTVRDGVARWRANGNLSLSVLARILRIHTDQAGWEWGGVDEMGGKVLAHRMYFNMYDGQLLLSKDHLDGADWGYVDVVGRTASVHAYTNAHQLGVAEDALQEWAEDFGYKLALNTLMKIPEDIETFNNGGPRPDYFESPMNPAPPSGTLRCPECGQIFPSYGLYMEHRQNEEPMGDELDREDGHFPEMDMDKALKPHFHEREPVTFPLAHVVENELIERYPGHFDKFWGGPGDRHYGAYLNGELVGLATINHRSASIAAVSAWHRVGQVYTTLVQTLQRHYPELDMALPSAADNLLLTRLGFAETSRGLLKWAAGKEPTDLLPAPVPFIYDIDKDTISLGAPGQDHKAIMGDFTKGGIVEGMYEPGGKITVRWNSSYPMTLRHLVDLWYWQLPHLRVTDIEEELPDGTTQKLTKTITATDVGSYIKTLAMADPAAWNAYQALKREGGEVYVVGGAVRDALLGREPKDIDMMVRGLDPEKVERILRKAPGKLVEDKKTGDVKTGKDFGVFRFRSKGSEVEIALPRTERSTGDRRVDFDVSVDHTLPIESDLLRRDFTVNAMAVDLDGGHLVDPYSGAQDIKDRRLRTVHPSSFEEDPTRLVRALVAFSKHGIVPDEATRAEMVTHASRLGLESRERIQAELDKLFASRNPAGAIRLAQETGLLAHVFPEVSSSWDFDQRNYHHNYPLGTHLLNVLEGIQDLTDDPDLRLSALLHDIGKPSSQWIGPDGVAHYYRKDGQGADHDVVGAAMAEQRLRGLKYPKARIQRIHHLIRHHMFPAFDSSRGARKFLNRVGDEHANDLLLLRHADQYGKGTDEYQDTKTPVDDMRQHVEGVRAAGEATGVSSLALNGNDLIALGIPQGPQIGQTLQMLTEAVLENPQINTPEGLTELINGHQASTFT